MRIIESNHAQISSSIHSYIYINLIIFCNGEALTNLLESLNPEIKGKKSITIIIVSIESGVFQDHINSAIVVPFNSFRDKKNFLNNTLFSNISVVSII